jgi:hypothetical protein
LHIQEQRARGEDLREAHSAVAHVGNAGVASAPPSHRHRGRREGHTRIIIITATSTFLAVALQGGQAGEDSMATRGFPVEKKAVKPRRQEEVPGEAETSRNCAGDPQARGVMGERGRARKANRKGGQGRSRRGRPKPHLAGARVWPSIGQSRAAVRRCYLGSRARRGERELDQKP